MFTRVGQFTRQLHDALHELGYDHVIANSAQTIPDARGRLSYIARKTEEAATKAMDAVDAAQPMQERLLRQMTLLTHRWEQIEDLSLVPPEFAKVVRDTRDFLAVGPREVAATVDHLRNIMLAQDFQDLTGQVVRKVMDVTQHLESDLIQLLLDSAPPGVRPELSAAARSDAVVLHGPEFNASMVDAVNSQSQVDDLLESLGF